MTLTEFLLARIEEDGAAARQSGVDWEADDAFEQQALHFKQPHEFQCGWRVGEGLDKECGCNYPARVLAECEAKRRIVEGLQPFGWLDDINAPEILGLLATVYADHPDYLTEWGTP